MLAPVALVADAAAMVRAMALWGVADATSAVNPAVIPAAPITQARRTRLIRTRAASRLAAARERSGE